MKSFKKTLALWLVVLLTFLSIVPVFLTPTAQAEPLSDAVICQTLGMIVGQGSGVTPEYLAQTPTRIQAAVMYLRLKGLESAAKIYGGNENFPDVNQAGWEEGKTIMGYLKSNPQLGWVGRTDGTFDPTATIRAQEYYKVLLEALGYKQDTDFQWETVLSFAASKGLSKVADIINFSIENLATATVEALKAEVKGEGKTLIQKLSEGNAEMKSIAEGLGLVVSSPSPTPTATPAGPISYVSLTAKTASSLSVKFSAPVYDATKITFTMVRDSNISETPTITWSEDKTEAILSRSYPLLIAVYSVTVMNDTVNLGTKSVTIETEKIGKIDIVSDAFYVNSDNTSEVSYKVTNQYGDDISTAPMVQNIKWTVSADSVSLNLQTATLTITKTSYPQLKEMSSVTVTGIDPSTGTVGFKTLTVSTGMGTLRSFKFKGIYNKDGKTNITVGTLDKFYIDYEATDSSGKAADSYVLLSNTNAFMLMNPNPNIQAHVVRDPDNLSKAKIEIDVHTSFGTGVIYGIIPGTSASDSITVTVQQSASLGEFTLLTPSSYVQANEKIEIPYKAIDQNGNTLTRFEDITGKVSYTLSDSSTCIVTGERGSDGTYKLYARFNASKNYSILATTGQKVSQLVVDVKAPASPTYLYAVNSDIVLPYIVPNGQIKVDFRDYPGFTLLDQSNREYSLADNNVIGTDYYYVNAVSGDTSKISVLGNSVAYKNIPITLVGGSTLGSTTVTFELCKDTDNDPSSGKTVLSSKSVTIGNIAKTDIISYEIKSISTLYANSSVSANDTYQSVTAQKQEYASDIVIFGKTSSGGKVALNPTIGSGGDILQLTVTDPSKFALDVTNRKILAKTIGTDSEATDKLVATVQGGNGYITTASLDIKSSKTVPVAQSIDSSIKYGSAITKSGDSYSASSSAVTSAIVGHELRKYNDSGADTLRSELVFEIRDQYGKSAITPTYFNINKTAGNGTLSINSSSGLVSGIAVSGDQYVITAVTVNGITKIITLNVQ